MLGTTIPGRALATRKVADQRGFTLIELSIVLVLIGLIIGGVLKGQEMINSTRLKMTVNQADAVKAAVNVFQDKYIQLPGDYDEATVYIGTQAGSDGDGDGLINDAAGGAGVASITAADNVESSRAWEQMQVAQILGQVDLNDTTDTDDNFLPAKVDGTSWQLIFGTIDGRTAHWLRLEQSDGAGAAATNVITSLQAAEIDRKYDDTQPDTGSIRADDGATPAATTCRTGATPDAYANSDTDNCVLVIELL